MDPPNSQHLAAQIAWLFILAIPIACVAWTVTHEEVFSEPRDFFVEKSKHARSLLVRKLCYLFTCEYCFSHWVSALFLALTRYKLLLDDWRGYVLSLFALVWVANLYMSLYGRLRVDIRSEKAQATARETEVKKLEAQVKQEERKLEPHATRRHGGNGS